MLMTRVAQSRADLARYRIASLHQLELGFGKPLTRFGQDGESVAGRQLSRVETGSLDRERSVLDQGEQERALVVVEPAPALEAEGDASDDAPLAG